MRTFVLRIAPRISPGILASIVVTSLLAPAPARANDRDSATVGKITLLNRKAVDAYQHLEFDAAVRILNEALELSEHAGLTQHPIRARTFVTLGIVTLGGLKQRDPALKYFRKALQIQPEIRLSSGLANPEIQAAFDEAVAGLANGVSDDLPPEKALVLDPVSVGQAGHPVPITVNPDKDLGASALVLRYRAAASSSFTDVPMEKSPSGSYEAAIPADATHGAQVAYFVEARRADGGVMVARGSAADPMVVSLAPEAAVDAGPSPVAEHPQAPRRLFFAVMGGTGFGTTSGTGEETRNAVMGSGIDWGFSGHLSPEIGYLLTARFMLSVQARLQMVSGATEYHPPGATGSECGTDHTCSPATGAIAGLLKATWLLSDPEATFAPYLALSAGGGTIRHVSKVDAPMTCGSTTKPEACMDTVAGGPVLFGPTLGFRVRVSNAVGIVAELAGLVGVPDFMVNADVNVGVAFQM